MDQELLYKFIKINLSQFAFFEENYEIKEEYNLQTQIKFSYDEDQLLRCICLLEILQLEKCIIKCELECYFQIESNSIKIITEKDRISFPIPLLIQFSSLTYGTLRGVIFTKLMGTHINNLIIPPMNMIDIIDKPFIVDRGNKVSD